MSRNTDRPPRAPGPTRSGIGAAALVRCALFALVWTTLAGGDPGTWPFGLAAVVAATALSLRLKPPGAGRLRLVGVVWFVPHFLVRSLVGGIDVARRALDPRLPIAPGMVGHRWRLPEGAARVAFADVISLLPGTLGAGMAGDRLEVHALDVDLPLADQFDEEERRIARLFDPPPPAAGPGSARDG